MIRLSYMLFCDGYSCYVQDMTVSYDRYGGGCMRITAVVVFIFEVWLSHENGEKSGEESAWLARRTGIKEGLLRRAAHVVLFLGIALLAGCGYSWYGIAAVAVWSIVDEATKSLVPGRHCSALAIGLNLVGTAIGLGLWALAQ